MLTAGSAAIVPTRYKCNWRSLPATGPSPEPRRPDAVAARPDPSARVVAAPAPGRHGVGVGPQSCPRGTCGALGGGERGVDLPALVVPRQAVSHQGLVDLDPANTHSSEQPAVLILSTAVDGHVLAMDQFRGELLRAGRVGLPVLRTVDALQPDPNRLPRRANRDRVAIVNGDDGPGELARYCGRRLEVPVRRNQHRRDDEDLL